MVDPFLQALVAAPALPGYEDEVRALLRRELRNILEEDAIGNLTTRVGTDRPHVIFCAHMDQVGLMAVGVEDDGAVRFRPLGTVDEATLPGRHVRVLTPQGAAPGVIGISPPHLREGGEAPAGWPGLSIDVGAKSREEATAIGVRPPLPVAFASELFEMQGHLVGRGIDDRICCFLLARLAARLRQQPPDAAVTVAWTAQNEIGLRGARVLAGRDRYDVAVHLAAFGTTEGVSPQPPTSYVRLGGGPVLRMRAGDGFASSEAVAWIQRAAAEADIVLQKGATAGESEATIFQEAGSFGGSVNLPIRYLHTDVEMVAQYDVEGLERLLHLLIDRIDQAPHVEGLRG